MAEKLVDRKEVDVAKIDDRIVELEAELVTLRAEKARGGYQEYPKWIADAYDPTGQRGTTVNSKEEEAAAKSGKSAGGVASADQKLKSEEIRKNSEDEAKAEEPINRPARETGHSDAEKARAHELDKANAQTDAERARAEAAKRKK